ncbi:MAG TPA: PKD domain-containing protein [Bacteroidales bacterium]|nr:PKD domain-containing protein [Bacteroidales bacterium]
MNDPEIYLIEPYNAYLPKRKRHWHDIVAEQELYARILAEANRNATLAPNMPDQAMPPIQPIPPAAGGGSPAPEFFTPDMDAEFDFIQSIDTGSAPALVTFNFSGDSIFREVGSLNVEWDFGDGTVGTGFDVQHWFNTTGSNANNEFDVTMSVYAKVDLSKSASVEKTIQINPPTVVAAFTLGSPATLTGNYYTASAGQSIPFINGTVTNNPLNPITYLWNFGSGSEPDTSNAVNPHYSYADAGDYTVTLQATGSFGIMSAGTRKIQIVEAEENGNGEENGNPVHPPPSGAAP